MDRDPRAVLHAWLPHLVVIALLVVGGWVLTLVLRPLLEPILLAAALAMLTTPFIYRPIQQVVDQVAPGLSASVRRQIAGVTATAALVALLLAPVVIVLANTVGSVSATFDMVVGLATKDEAQLALLEARISEKLAYLDRLYPNIDINRFELASKIKAIVAEALDFGSAVLNFLFAGTGVLAHLLLAVISLSFFYAEGPRLARAFLAYSPLDDAQQERLIVRYRMIMLRLINDTVATALAKGLVLAGLIWIIDHGFGQGVLPFVPIVVVGAVITLLPVVGVTMVWLPLAGLEWSLGHFGAAIAMGLCCTAAHFGLDYLLAKLGRHLDDRESWMSFLLFLGVVGGLLSFGIKGLVIGPMAVVFVATITSFWGPLYGLGPAPSMILPRPGSEDEAPPPMAADDDRPPA